uniref:CD59 glycoprotein n=1 Tax=Jaculus jaculus TaxID=51337 RepID=UPI0003330CB4|nr:CD59 glycoprotein [Jaculus jaculus]
MRGPGGLILPLLLILLAVFCSTGFSLNCYNCLNPDVPCKINVTCVPNLDACLFVESDKQVYQQCWRFSDCNSRFISTRLGLSNLKYRCCQKDMCNAKLEENEEKGAAPFQEKMSLLTTLVLVAGWNLCL